MSLKLPTGFEPHWNLTIDTPSYWEHLDTTYHWRINFARRNLYCGHSSRKKGANHTASPPAGRGRPAISIQASMEAWPWSQTITKNDQWRDKTTPSSSGPTHCFHTDSPAVSTGKLLLYPHGWCFGEFRYSMCFTGYGTKEMSIVSSRAVWSSLFVCRPTHCFHTNSPAVSTGKLLLYPHGRCFGEFRIQHVFNGLRDKRDVDCVFSCCLIVVVRLLPLTLSDLTALDPLCCSIIVVR
jgi:hypothetical protein